MPVTSHREQTPVRKDRFSRLERKRRSSRWSFIPRESQLHLLITPRVANLTHSRSTRTDQTEVPKATCNSNLPTLRTNASRQQTVPARNTDRSTFAAPLVLLTGREIIERINYKRVKLSKVAPGTYGNLLNQPTGSVKIPNRSEFFLAGTSASFPREFSSFAS